MQFVYLFCPPPQLRGSLMTLVRKRKSFQSKSLVSLEDVTACVWGQCLALLGLERPQGEEAETVESQVTVGPG